MRRARKIGEAGATRGSERLVELEREFGAFRARSPKAMKRRYPRELRRKVLLALDEGVPMNAVLSACRITIEHLRRWQGEQYRGKAEDIGAGEPARVFEVAPNSQTKPETSGRKAFEIRIGRWALELRLEPSSANCS